MATISGLCLRRLLRGLRVVNTDAGRRRGVGLEQPDQFWTLVGQRRHVFDPVVDIEYTMVSLANLTSGRQRVRDDELDVRADRDDLDVGRPTRRELGDDVERFVAPLVHLRDQLGFRVVRRTQDEVHADDEQSAVVFDDADLRERRGPSNSWYRHEAIPIPAHHDRRRGESDDDEVVIDRRARTTRMPGRRGCGVPDGRRSAHRPSGTSMLGSRWSAWATKNESSIQNGCQLYAHFDGICWNSTNPEPSHS